MERPTQGNNVVDFEMEDYYGKMINLSDFKGKKIYLSFFREASCPFCNLRVHQLIKRYQEFKDKNIVIITFFASSKEEIANYAGKQQVPFIIIPDADSLMYKKYNIKQSSLGMIKTMTNPIKMLEVMFSKYFNLNALKSKPILPADFLIDENQQIYRAFYGKDFGDHLTFEEILNWK
ncbi:MAG: redoxin domain-containing protein [Vicingaceae bacterium]|nr:redoxin domain-containing protein [Vicingaceae bacterium]